MYGYNTNYNGNDYQQKLIKSMKITIHRGTDHIGGSVTEYEHEGWKLFVDYGEQLPGVEIRI